jgi:hypothetical protein
MTILWSIGSAVITTLVFNFFLQRMVENAKKPWMKQQHQQIIKFLSSPNATACVQLPNGSDKLYKVVLMPIDYLIAGGPEDKQLEAFDVMMEQKIVLPVSEQYYRLSRNYQDKYRKCVLTLAYEEFGFKWLVGSLLRLLPFHKSSNSGVVRL